VRESALYAFRVKTGDQLPPHLKRTLPASALPGNNLVCSASRSFVLCLCGLLDSWVCLHDIGVLTRSTSCVYRQPRERSAASSTASASGTPVAEHGAKAEHIVDRSHFGTVGLLLRLCVSWAFEQTVAMTHIGLWCLLCHAQRKQRRQPGFVDHGRAQSRRCSATGASQCFLCAHAFKVVWWSLCSHVISKHTIFPPSSQPDAPAGPVAPEATAGKDEAMAPLERGESHAGQKAARSASRLVRRFQRWLTCGCSTIS